MILTLNESSDDPSVPLLAIDSDRRIIGATHAARRLLNVASDDALDDAPLLKDVLTQPTPSPSFAEAERAVVEAALSQTQGNVSAAAKVLGVSRATLHRKIHALR